MLQNFININIAQCVAETSFFSIFQDGVHMPTLICLEHIWTTHKEYLVVSITGHNLGAIDEEVSII